VPDQEASSQTRGRQAERLAGSYLERAGFKVEARNLRLGGGELDLIAREGETLVFVEVKGRARLSLVAPEEAVDLNKRRRLVAAAEAYLARQGLPTPPCRFDVVAVEFGRGEPQVRHLRDAFRPGE